ncbi:hypothetical protein HZS_4532, partial [Henneguya salminicola]
MCTEFDSVEASLSLKYNKTTITGASRVIEEFKMNNLIEEKDVAFPIPPSDPRPISADRHSSIEYSEPTTPVYHQHKNFRAKFNVFNFMDHPVGFMAKSYHFIMYFDNIKYRFVLTLVGFIFSIVSILLFSNNILVTIFIIFQMILLTVYIVEYALRAWACTVMEKYRRLRRASYLVSPYMLIVEKSSEDRIQSMADSFYFTISFLTIGYGDIVPSSNTSRYIIITLAFLGVALAAVPSGIIGSGFALQVASRNKRRHQREIVKPAITLIQRAGRAYFYSMDSSITSDLDYTTTLNNSKNKSFFIRGHNMALNINDTSSLNQDSNKFKLRQSYFKNQPFSHSLSAKAMLEPKTPLYQIFSRFKVQKKDITNDEYDLELIKPIIFLCGKFVRYLQFKAAVKKFKKTKHPLCTEEFMENIEYTQKKTTYYITQILENLESHASIPISNTHVCQDCEQLTFQINELKLKISNIENNINRL